MSEKEAKIFLKKLKRQIGRTQFKEIGLNVCSCEMIRICTKLVYGKVTKMAIECQTFDEEYL